MHVINPDFIDTKYEPRKNKLGYTIIGMSAQDVISIFNGLGICDHCGQQKSYGYLIPVMGRKWHCTQCHVEWENTDKFYAEDLPYEAKVLAEFQHIIKNHEGVQM